MNVDEKVADDMMQLAKFMVKSADQFLHYLETTMKEAEAKRLKEIADECDRSGSLTQVQCMPEMANELKEKLDKNYVPYVKLPDNDGKSTFLIRDCDAEKVRNLAKEKEETKIQSVAQAIEAAGRKLASMKAPAPGKTQEREMHFEK